ncbi:MAG: precorrin-8X methylmutase [Thermodesulfovibrionales bacterium]
MENIILIGHGSPKKDANNVEMVGRLLHQAIHPGCSKGCVKVAYLQFAEPDLMDTIKESVHGGAGRVIVHPFFLSSGMHVTKDIPEMIQEAERIYPGVEFVYTEPLGIHEKLVHVVLERIASAGFKAPGDIEKRSFEIISDEIDLSNFPPEQLPVVKRVIHATADFEFKNSLVFYPDAVRTGIEAIRAGKDILTDIKMVKAGINKRLLKKWGGKVICNIQQSAFSHQQSEVKTKAEMGIESALKENNNIGIIAIGNAPTALLKTIELFNLPVNPFTHSPILVVGVPVGFVKALESKALLSTQKFPFITNLSRKGGTPVAVAIVNALLKMADGG